MSTSVEYSFWLHDYEILVVSFWHFYLEFCQITITLMYVSGPDFEGAATRIAESYNYTLSQSADKPIFLLGAVCSCKLSNHLLTLQQHVNCGICLMCTLDKCYGSKGDGYESVCSTPLDKSFPMIRGQSWNGKSQWERTTIDRWLQEGTDRLLGRLLWQPTSTDTNRSCYVRVTKTESFQIINYE